MKLNIQTDYSTVVVFFENVVEIINSAIVGQKYNDEMSNFLNGMINIIHETTGMLISPKYRNDALFLEISNLRSMDTAFFIASNSHEISEDPYINMDEIKEKYESSVRELCEKSKLTKFVLSFTWNKIQFADEDEPVMLFGIDFELPVDVQQKCFSRLNTYLNEKLKLDWR